MRPIQALRMRTAGAGGPATIIRGAASIYVNGTNTATITLPVGSQAGDTVVMSVGHSWPLNGLTWSGANTGILNLQGPNYNGLTYYGTLDAADITRGYLSFSWGGSGNGVVDLIVLAGSHTYQDSGGTRNGSGASSRAVSTGSSVSVGANLFLMGSAYLATDATSSSLTSTLLHEVHTGGSGVCRYGVATASGVQSGTVNYSGSPGGDYQVLVAMS